MAQEDLGMMVYKGHVSDVKGNVVEYATIEPLRKELALPFNGRDSLALNLRSYSLKEVMVQARNIERKADRFVISVLPSSGKDGTELLSQAPGVCG